jgi:hypothetical protein
LSDAAPEVREAYIQKKLCSRPAWIGIIIHEALEWLIKQNIAGYSPTPEQLVERFRRKALQQIEDSERGFYRFRPSKTLGFVEHYYEIAGMESWEDSVTEICRQLSELKSNRILLRTLTVIGQVQEVEELKQIEINGVRVWVSIDALVSDTKGGLTIVDWKTGKAHTDESVSAQLSVYALYVLRTYLRHETESDGLAKIRTVFANLRSGEHKVWTVSADDLKMTRQLIASSADAMRSRLSVVETNVALKENFPKVEEGSELCGRCKFRRTCER